MEKTDELEQIKNQRKELKNSKKSAQSDLTKNQIQQQIDDNMMKQRKEQLKRLENKKRAIKTIAENFENIVNDTVATLKLFGIKCNRQILSEMLGYSETYLKKIIQKRYLPQIDCINELEETVRQFQDNLPILLCETSEINQFTAIEGIKRILTDITSLKNLYVKTIIRI